MKNTEHTNSYCLVVLVAACVIAVLSPITLIDMVVGGFAGATLAQLLFAQKIPGQLGFGLVGGLIAWVLSILTMTLLTRSAPQSIAGPLDVLWLAILHLWTIPGVLLAIIVNQVVWKRKPMMT